MSVERDPSFPGNNLIIISGPSGVGKSTVVRELLRSCDLPLELSVSATTRAPREGEVDGVDYFFVSKEDFQTRRESGEFLECAEVFGVGDWYGTPEQPVRNQVANGKMVILEIDVQGAMLVLDRYPETTSVFIHPGDLQELETRLRGRETEQEEQIQQRLAVAAKELEMATHYQYIVKNDDIQATAAKICSLLTPSGEQSCTTS